MLVVGLFAQTGLVVSAPIPAFGSRCLSLFFEEAHFEYKLIPESELKNLRPFPGVNSPTPIFQAEYFNRKVIVKFKKTNWYKYDPEFWEEEVKSAENSARNEAYWLSWLNQQGIGVKFLGFTRVKSQLGIITEQLDKNHIVLKIPNSDDTIKMYADEFKQKKIIVDASAIKSIERTINLLVKNNVMIFDIQFIFTRDGQVLLIDAEGFRFHRPQSDIFTPKQLGDRAKKEFKRILRGLIARVTLLSPTV